MGKRGRERGLNPADAFRKAQKKKEKRQKQNKQKRIREHSTLYKSEERMREELLKLESAEFLDPGRKKKRNSLRAALAKADEKNEQEAIAREKKKNAELEEIGAQMAANLAAAPPPSSSPMFMPQMAFGMMPPPPPGPPPPFIPPPSGPPPPASTVVAALREAVAVAKPSPKPDLPPSAPVLNHKSLSALKPASVVLKKRPTAATAAGRTGPVRHRISAALPGPVAGPRLLLAAKPKPKAPNVSEQYESFMAELQGLEGFGEGD